MSLVALLLFACSGPATPPEALPEPEVAPEPAPPASAPIAVEPVSIRWDAGRSSIEVEVRLTGSELAARKEPVYVGVTVVTEADAEIDLLVHTLFPGSLEQSLQFAAELPQTPKHVLIGAWDTKVEPCAVDRPGCKEFGFVLDDSLASFPGRLYTEGMRQRFLPASYPVNVKGDVAKVRDATGRFAAVFGASVELVAAETDRPTGVWVGASDDLGFAFDVASALGGASGPLPYGQADGLSSPMVVVLPE